ncbi:Ger(x)C family spore germination protein [Evansella halocellulosilytica]|uniref:Ger(x)C family spore germination protein n=1 Tax=Evansella halocellulosilytica TaxID=2011013 RepID=UPI000BB9475F|nr:Ger(x)C family spore germination protein [Evansella halocellulosilytica]
MNKLASVFIILFIFIQTGCWDQREIDELGFVIAVAIDPTENGNENEFTTTYQFAVPGAIEEEGGNGVSSESAFFNKGTSNTTNLKAARNMAKRRSRMVFFEHLKVIIINEDIAKNPEFEHLLDFYVRNHEMRRSIYVLISKGSARDILEGKRPLADMPAMSIDLIREKNTDFTFTMIEPREIGDIASLMIGGHSFLMTRITSNGGELKIGGAAIFKGETNELIGWLDEMEVTGYNWVIGETHHGVMEVPFQDDELIVFEADGVHSDFDYDLKNNQFHIDIRTEGVLGESWIHHMGELDEEMIKEIEAAIGAEIEKRANNIIEKMQTEYYVDVFELWEEVRIHHYKYWKGVEGNWDGEDGEFAKANFTVHADVEIRDHMLIESME